MGVFLSQNSIQSSYVNLFFNPKMSRRLLEEGNSITNDAGVDHESLLLTGSRKSGLSLSWKEPLPTPVYEIHHQSSVDSNPYVSLESPPASPHPSDSGPSTLNRRKKLFTFSRPPRSRDTDKFLDALSEQLGHRVTLVDDFVPGDNDYEEVRRTRPQCDT